mmetsp:Transcript_23996/g.55789  ORF Transcript_23996/g.55789 Transcript_23996/m.55789 type:complete len:229 (+) Transcript_23996:29-715(+)
MAVPSCRGNKEGDLPRILRAKGWLAFKLKEPQETSDSDAQGVLPLTASDSLSSPEQMSLSPVPPGAGSGCRGRRGCTSSPQTAQHCSSSLSSSLASSSKSFSARHSGHCQSEQKPMLPQRRTSSSVIMRWSPIQATWRLQQPLPLTLLLRASWVSALPRVLKGVAAKAGIRGSPSSTKAFQALARRFLRRARSISACSALLAERGAGGRGSACTPRVLVSTFFLATAD